MRESIFLPSNCSGVPVITNLGLCCTASPSPWTGELRTADDAGRLRFSMDGKGVPKTVELLVAADGKGRCFPLPTGEAKPVLCTVCVKEAAAMVLLSRRRPLPFAGLLMKEEEETGPQAEAADTPLGFAFMLLLLLLLSLRVALRVEEEEEDDDGRNDDALLAALPRPEGTGPAAG